VDFNAAAQAQVHAPRAEESSTRDEKNGQPVFFDCVICHGSKLRSRKSKCSLNCKHHSCKDGLKQLYEANEPARRARAEKAAAAAAEKAAARAAASAEAAARAAAVAAGTAAGCSTCGSATTYKWYSSAQGKICNACKQKNKRSARSADQRALTHAKQSKRRRLAQELGAPPSEFFADVTMQLEAEFAQAATGPRIPPLPHLSVADSNVIVIQRQTLNVVAEFLGFLGQ